MNNILLGISIASFLLAAFAIFLLYKKNTTENNTDTTIKKQNIKNRRNKDSNIDNDISSQVETKKPEKQRKERKKRRFNILNKNKN